MDCEVYIVDTVDSWNEFKSYVDEEKFEIISLDVETDSVKEKVAKLYGIGLCFKPGQAFYIPIRKSDGTLWWKSESDIRNSIVQWCKSLKLIGHNVLYDVLVLENNWKIDLSPYIYSDTILQKHILSEDRPFGLKEVAVLELGDWADKAQTALEQNVLSKGGSWTKEHKDMYLADTAVLGEYCAFDAMLCRMLFDKFEPQIYAEGLDKLFYQEETMPLYREVTINMKRQGFPVDVKHFQSLKTNIVRDIDRLEKELMNDLSSDVEEFEKTLLDKECPVKATGSFPKFLAEVLSLDLPKHKKTGVVTLAAKEVEKMAYEYPLVNFYQWLLGQTELVVESEATILQAQKSMYFSRTSNQDKKYIFNLGSNDHLIWLFFTKYGLSPLSYTEKGKPQVDDKFLESSAAEHPMIRKLLDYKKLNKLLTTYIEGVLERHIGGVIYTSMLQYGTTSGRFASRDLNMQNLPAIKKGKKDLISEYTTAIRTGYVSGPDNVIVSSDWNSLEPHLAAYVSEDKGLVDIFVNGQDFYSAIGIKQFDIKDATPFKDGSPNSFPVKYPDLRDLVKVYALSAFYGAGAPRISQQINEDGEMTKKESIEKAAELLSGFFRAFPSVKKFIDKTHFEAKKQGKAVTKLGRVRHLSKLKDLMKAHGENLLDWKFAKEKGLGEERGVAKNLLNNAVNFKIQGLAAHAANRAMILAQRKFKEQNLSANIVLMIHDELIAICKREEAERVKAIIKWAMENCLDLSPIKLKAEPIICNNLGEAKG